MKHTNIYLFQWAYHEKCHSSSEKSIHTVYCKLVVRVSALNTVLELTVSSLIKIRSRNSFHLT